MVERPGVDVRERFSFDKTVEHEDYIAVNREFVERIIPLERNQLIVDLCCGSGLFSRLVQERLQGLSGRIVGIDTNEASVRKAQKLFVPRPGDPIADFFVDSAENLLEYVKPGTVRRVIIGNSFHELPDDRVRERVADSSYIAIDDDGEVDINSCFTDASESTEAKWGFWKSYSATEAGGKRNKKNLKTFQVAKVGEFTDILRRAGFNITSDRISKQEWPLSKGTMMDFAEYDTFIKNMFSDIDLPEYLTQLSPDDPERLQVLSDALKRGLNATDERFKRQQRTAGIAEENLEEISLPRVWVDWVAQKTA